MQPVHLLGAGQQARKVGRIGGQPVVEHRQGVQPGTEVLLYARCQKAGIGLQSLCKKPLQCTGGLRAGRAIEPDPVDGQVVGLVQVQLVPGHLDFVEQLAKAPVIRALGHQRIDVLFAGRLQRRALQLPAPGTRQRRHQPARGVQQRDGVSPLGQQRGHGFDQPAGQRLVHQRLRASVDQHGVGGEPEGDRLYQPAGRLVAGRRFGCGRGIAGMSVFQGGVMHLPPGCHASRLRAGQRLDGRHGPVGQLQWRKGRMLAQPAVMSPVGAGRQGQRLHLQRSPCQRSADAGQGVLQQPARQPGGRQQGARQKPGRAFRRIPG